jgi:hypothetical protein
MYLTRHDEMVEKHEKNAKDFWDDAENQLAAMEKRIVERSNRDLNTREVQRKLMRCV